MRYLCFSSCIINVPRSRYKKKMSSASSSEYTHMIIKSHQEKYSRVLKCVICM